MAGQIRIGTSGWNYDHWQGPFYPDDLPQDRWFEHYASTFDTVEINNTFYNQPEKATFDAWRDQAPDGFLYAVKANRYLTHMKHLKDADEPLEGFLSGARRLKNHLGPLLYQLPGNWHPDLERLEQFVNLLPGNQRHTIEFRNDEWLSDETFALLEEHDIALCVHDLLDDHPRRVTAPFAYVRFHGSGRKYGGKYPQEQLDDWAAWMSEIAKDRDVFAYFNNDEDGHAVADARKLRDTLQE